MDIVAYYAHMIYCKRIKATIGFLNFGEQLLNTLIGLNDKTYHGRELLHSEQVRGR